MNKLNKIFLVIIIILCIMLGVMAYYYIQLRNLYADTADSLIETRNQMYSLIEERQQMVYSNDIDDSNLLEEEIR